MYLLCAICIRPYGEHIMATEGSLGIDDPVGKSGNKDDGKCSVCTGHINKVLWEEEEIFLIWGNLSVG